MSATIHLPRPLHSCAGGRAEIPIEGATVADALGRLASAHPRLRRHLFDEDGSLRPHVNVYLNESDVSGLEGEGTLLSDGDSIMIVPSIAGGSSLSRPEILRYSRHLVMPEVGREGQEKLKGARVLLVGVGGLGSPAALYLAAAGVGTLGMVDHDVVDATNLQRQVLYGDSDVGRQKLEAAEERVLEANPFVSVERHPVRLDSDNALEILEQYDIVVDGSDNFPTRYLVNDACVMLGKPNVYGAIFRFEGQVSVFWGEQGPCYRCLFRQPPPPGLVPSCAEAGVLGVLPGIVGSLQAMETIKLILGRGESLIGRLLLHDSLAMSWREMKLRKDPKCPVCSENPTQTELIDYQDFCGVGASASAETTTSQERTPVASTESSSESIPHITATELKERLDRGDEITLVDVRNEQEWEIGNLGPQGARLLPLQEIRERAEELDRDDDIVVYCRSGSRSALAARELRDAGFTSVANLRGGILAWSQDVDPSIPRY